MKSLIIKGWYRIQTPDNYIGGWMGGIQCLAQSEFELGKAPNAGYTMFQVIFTILQKNGEIVADLVLNDILKQKANQRFLKVIIP